MAKRRLQRGDRFYTDPSGVQGPRCTVVLEEMGNNDSLTYWKLNEVIQFHRRHPKATDKEIYQALGKRAEVGKNRGTIVHGIAEEWRPGKKIYWKRYDKEITGHIQGLILFLRDHQPKILYREKKGFSKKYRYGFTTDLIFTLQRGKAWYVCDIKTSPRIVDAFLAQVAANLNGALENKWVPKHARGAILQTFPNGTYNFRPVSTPFWFFRNYLENWWYIETQKPSLRELPKDWPASRRGVRKFKPLEVPPAKIVRRIPVRKNKSASRRGKKK